jgi:hypothetical protein
MDRTQFMKRKDKKIKAAADEQSNGFLTREQILGSDDIPTEIVSVDEWENGGKLRVRGLSGTQRDLWQTSLLEDYAESKKIKLENATARLISYCVVNADGSLMFSEADVEALGNKSGRALNRVYEVAQHLSGLSAKDVEELTEVQKKIPSADSGSG